jgi:hypothetical protein
MSSAANVARILLRPDRLRDELKSMSSESIQSVRKVVAASGSVTFLVAVMVGIVAASLAPMTLAVRAGALWAGLAIALGILALMLSSAAVFERSDALARKLTRLSDSGNRCEQALRWLANEDVRRYRDAVIASGRELVVDDFDAMASLIARERDQVREARRRATCRALHRPAGYGDRGAIIL